MSKLNLYLFEMFCQSSKYQISPCYILTLFENYLDFWIYDVSNKT